jgi:DNA-binding NarL/FixJ family response regulator
VVVTDIDPSALAELRAMVRQLQVSNSDGTSLAEVVRLARTVELASGITVDFDATADLGQPLIVVRLPSGQVLPSASLQALTPREREVAALVADGLSNKQIAQRLRITLGTVKHYVHQILEKTGLQGRVGIAKHIVPQAKATGGDAPPIFG